MKRRAKDSSKRKRQAFVFNPEEEIWYEPYMRNLHREFSDESVLCDSKIELPWRDIALSMAGMKIRPNVTLTHISDKDVVDEADNEIETDRTEKEDSTGAMILPWQDLVITRTSPIYPKDDPEMRICDSTVEIPWGELALEQPIEIRVPKEEKTCIIDDVEIPWQEILVPRNIIIKSEKKKQHPSSRQPPRQRVDAPCVICGTYPCCAKINPRIKETVHTTCM